jgi:hypothetical protein
MKADADCTALTAPVMERAGVTLPPVDGSTGVPPPPPPPHAVKTLLKSSAAIDTRFARERHIVVIPRIKEGGSTLTISELSDNISTCSVG